MVLLQDPVDIVRRDSFKGVGALISTLFNYSKDGLNNSVPHFKLIIIDPSHLDELDEVCQSINGMDILMMSFNLFIIAFISVDKYQLRQLWVELVDR